MLLAKLLFVTIVVCSGQAMLVKRGIVDNCGGYGVIISNHSCEKIDVVFVLDKSGSMGTQAGTKTRLEHLRDFVTGFANAVTIGVQDFLFAVACFNSVGTSKLTFPAQPGGTQDAADVIGAVPSTAGGNTVIASGLNEAATLLGINKRPNVPAVVILITDGVSAPTGIVAAADNLKNNHNALIICVGVGAFNLAQLQVIASNTNWVIGVDNFQYLQHRLDEILNLTCTASGGVTMCSQCTVFDGKYGYIGDNATCYGFYLCQTDPVTCELQMAHFQHCPNGTSFNAQSAAVGNPCVFDPTCYFDCNVTTLNSTCPYTKDPINERKFGYQDDLGNWHYYYCDDGMYFDATDEVCTCIPWRTEDCNCRYLTHFEGDLQDHSCTGGAVANSNPAVSLVPNGGVASFFGNGGAWFSGTSAQSSANGAHLSTSVMNGAFSGCGTNWGQHQLTVATWFNFNTFTPLMGNNYGLVTTCDSNLGPSIFLTLKNGKVHGGLQTQSTPGIPGSGFMVELSDSVIIVPGKWYYVSLVYADPVLSLYVNTRAQYLACAPNACTPVDSGTQTGCVQSRNCDFITGYSGIPNEFFVGMMDDVQVYDFGRYIACRQLI